VSIKYDLPTRRGRGSLPWALGACRAVAQTHARRSYSPFLWGLPGGTREPGDASSKDNSAREVHDEVELVLNKDRLVELLVVELSRPDGPEQVRYFSYELPPGEVPLKSRGKDAPDPEDAGLAWFDAEEINNLPIRPEDRRAVAHFFLTRGV
jgi:8-oxo-dGTP pyrophosphatase MutT (NUDIX family)